jgi:hypothetical protein
MITGGYILDVVDATGMRSDVKLMVAGRNQIRVVTWRLQILAPATRAVRPVRSDFGSETLYAPPATRMTSCERSRSSHYSHLQYGEPFLFHCQLV